MFTTQKRLISATLILILLLTSSTALAKRRKPKPKPEQTVVYEPVTEGSIKKDLTDKVRLAVETLLLSQKLNQDPGQNPAQQPSQNQKSVAKFVPERMTIETLLKRYKCSPYNDTCLNKAQPHVEGRGVLFLHLKETPAGVNVRVTLYSYDTNTYIIDQKEILIDPNAKNLQEAIDLALESSFFGNTGELSIELVGKDHVLGRLFVDDVLVPHEGYWTAKDLTFGPHVVKVESPDQTTEEKTVTLRAKAPQKLKFEVKDAPVVVEIKEEAPPPVEKFSPAQMLPWELPGYIALGVGVGGLVTGIVGSVFEVSGRNEIEQICHKTGNQCLNSKQVGNYLSSREEARRFKAAYEKGSLGVTLELIGYSVAVAGIATGGILLYIASAEDEEKEGDAEEKTLKSSVAFSLLPSPNAISASATLRF